VSTAEKALARADSPAEVLEQVVIHGDLSKLTPAQRVAYYRHVCESLGLNPFTKPFDYITLNGKLTLYARRDAADQLRRRDRISVQIVSRERMDDIFVVTARATTPDGRTDEATGAVSIAGLRGEALANAIMKAETKAKRRVTLSICGLGWLDESEADSIHDAQRVQVDPNSGEIIHMPAVELPANKPEPGQPAASRPVSGPRPKGNRSAPRTRMGIDWSSFWKMAKGELGLSEQTVHKQAAVFFERPGLKSLTDVVKEQDDLDRFAAYLRQFADTEAAEVDDELAGDAEAEEVFDV